MYHTAVGLEKMRQRTENKQTENRETEKAVTEATLIVDGSLAGLSEPIENRGPSLSLVSMDRRAGAGQ